MGTYSPGLELKSILTVDLSEKRTVQLQHSISFMFPIQCVSNPRPCVGSYCVFLFKLGRDYVYDLRAFLDTCS